MLDELTYVAVEQPPLKLLEPWWQEIYSPPASLEARASFFGIPPDALEQLELREESHSYDI